MTTSISSKAHNGMKRISKEDRRIIDNHENFIKIIYLAFVELSGPSKLYTKSLFLKVFFQHSILNCSQKSNISLIALRTD